MRKHVLALLLVVATHLTLANVPCHAQTTYWTLTSTQCDPLSCTEAIYNVPPSSYAQAIVNAYGTCARNGVPISTQPQVQGGVWSNCVAEVNLIANAHTFSNRQHIGNGNVYYVIQGLTATGEINDSLSGYTYYLMYEQQDCAGNSASDVPPDIDC